MAIFNNRLSQFLRGRANGCSLLVLTAIFVSGCGGAPAIVPDAEGAERISAIGMGCNRPHELTQNCSGFSGATLKVHLSEVEFKIAGSEDGTVVLLMGAKPLSDAWAGRSTENANIAFEVTKKYLIEEGIEISRVQPVSSGALLSGYVLTTGGDSFSLLSKHSVD